MIFNFEPFFWHLCAPLISAIQSIGESAGQSANSIWGKWPSEREPEADRHKAAPYFRKTTDFIDANKTPSATNSSAEGAVKIGYMAHAEILMGQTIGSEQSVYIACLLRQF